MKTRFLAMLIAVLMIVGAAVTVSASFSDVADGYAHTVAIETLAQLGVIGGYPDGTYQPDKNVTRGEMAALVYRLATTFANVDQKDTIFSDVNADNWASGYITWCNAKAIVGGYPTGDFKPQNNVSYDEALKMVCATLGYTDFDSALWPTDVRMKALKDLKLGEDIVAEGSDKLTRGQVAQLLYNALTVDMAEKKVDYVKVWVDADNDTTTGTNGKETFYMQPQEVPQTLATDVWKYVKTTYRVVATENKTFNGLASATADDAKVVLAEVLDNGNLGTPAAQTLENLKLEAYEEKTDALIGLDIMVLEQDGEVLGSAAVLGTLAPATVVASYNKDKTLVTNEITINGALYADVRNSDTKFANLKLLNTTTNAVTTSALAAVPAAVNSPFMALALDSEGDGIVDAIEILNYGMYKVTATPVNVKATSTTPAYVKYTVAADIDGASATINSYDIADAKTLAKDDIFVAAKANGTWYIDAVVAPVEAAATKITTGDDAAITLEGVGAVNYKDGSAYFAGSNDVIAFNAVNLLKADAPKQIYYIYNNHVIYTTANASSSSYDLALLLYTEEKVDGGIVDNKLVTTYPAVLLINGEKVTVNLNGNAAIDALTGDQVSEKATGADINNSVLYGGNSYRITQVAANDTTSKLPYTLVSYVKNTDGTYTLTTVNANNGETVVVPAGAQITKNNNTGIYTIGAYNFELDDNSVVYNIYNSTAQNDTYDYLATITKANILNKFNATTTTQATYLLRVEGADTVSAADDMYVLVASVINNGFVEVGATSTKTYLNDARLVKYAPATAIASMVDGKAYYEYSFLDIAAMTNGAAVVDTTKSIEEGATNVTAGNFYGWDETNKVYVAIDATTVADQSKEDSIKLNAITAVDTTRGIIKFTTNYTYTDGAQTVTEDFVNGIKLGADVKVWGTAGTAKNTYKTFDIASLAELLDTVRDTTISGGNASANLDCIIGSYTDEDGARQIAWIVVQNYYVEEVSNVNTLKATTDIVK